MSTEISQPGRNPSYKRIAIGVVVGFILLLATVGAVAIFNRSSHSDATLLEVPVPQRPDLTVWMERHDQAVVGKDHYVSPSVCRVRNNSAQPIVIQRIQLNGEYSAPLCKLLDDRTGWVESPQAYPVKLSIGECLYALHRQSGGGPYARDVLFVDILTDRGEFRVTFKD